MLSESFLTVLLMFWKGRRPMKRLYWIFALLLLGIAATAQAPKTRVFVSKEGHFSIKFPERPTYSQDDAETDSVTGPLHTFLVDQKEIAYYISYTDFKPGLIKQVDKEKI